MRIAGEDRHNPWKFEKINMSDFDLKSIPDFELTGNVLNSNKQLEINKKIAIYQMMVGNPFFIPQTRESMQSLHALTKWFLDGMDEVGIVNFLPPMKGKAVITPEEENARFLQGDVIEPTPEEDHIYHIRKHEEQARNPAITQELRAKLIEHIAKHLSMLKNLLTRQQVMGNAPQPVQPQMGGPGGQRPQINAQTNNAGIGFKQPVGGAQTGLRPNV